ncbi:MAG: TolC family protein [Asticcacaulis sp.]|uniref:TolC family protein n=1 Tax=Asticcacaulis sp. TaxID=1872648 RepID=UPI003F7B9B10
MIRRLLLAASLLTLSACVSAPLHAPETHPQIANPAAQGAFLNADNPAFAAHAVPGDWWKLYNDATLNKLIDDALKANANLREANARLEKAEAGLDLARAAASVHTDLKGQFGYGMPSAQEFLLLGEHIPSDFLYSVDGSVSYQLDLSGQVKNAIQASGADMGAAQAAYDAVRVSVVADTTRAWLDVCATGREAALTQDVIVLQNQTGAAVRRLKAAGRGAEGDVTRSQAQEALARATLPALQAAHAAALYRLALLTGRAPSELSPGLNACKTLPTVSQAIPIGDGAALLKRRPDVRASQFALEAAEARAGAARAALYPRIVLGASLGSGGLASDALRYDTMKYSLGPLISWEFPNQKVATAHIKAANADIDLAEAHFDGVVLAALKETEAALNLYAHDLDQRAELQTAHDHAAQNLAQTLSLQKAGRVSLFPVLDARRAVLSADQALAMMDAKIAADQVQVFLALGGGWQAD